ncbi:MAG: VWA domain-containing protein [Bacteroidales bacterium]|nr:VWA domain-containing protein [Bacteroidales bacterium]
MIHFEHITYLYFLLVIPALYGIFFWTRFRKKKKLALFADSPLLVQLQPELSRRRPHIKFTLLMLALAFLIITIANPQVGTKMVKGERLGADIAICMDVSNSMMAEDIAPNRLARSQRAVSTLLDQLGSDRVSLVVFAGSSFIQMPLTTDYSAAKMFVDQMDCNMIQAQGTAIGDAINTAMQSFGYGDPDREWEKKLSRTIIIISDGENHEDDAIGAAKEAYAEGVMVNTIGMGTTKGTPIPEYRNGQNNGYKHDREGNIVTTQLNEQMLVDIAQAGGGIYVRAANINAGIDEIVKQLEHLEKENYGSSIFSEYESRFQYPLAAALLCLLAEVLIAEKRNKKYNLGKLLKR